MSRDIKDWSVSIPWIMEQRVSILKHTEHMYWLRAFRSRIGQKALSFCRYSEQVGEEPKEFLKWGNWNNTIYT